ncbi:E3 ubiquitin-protein ligase RAD18, partial [Geosmithia morbida]
MANHDVADSTDWLSTSLSALSALESALRCQVCKDFYETPMITSCSHTFCSLCIRRALSNENKCPLCRASEQEIRLRSNWSMEEAVQSFKKARPSVLELARKKMTTIITSKRKATVPEGDEQAAPDTKRLRSSARLSQKKTEPADDPEDEEKQDQEEIVIQASDDEDYTPEPADGLVPCPSCQKRMKEWQVFQHLESCPGPVKPRPQRQDNTLQPGTPFPSLSHRQQPAHPLERLPSLSYSMLKDQALRKKLGDLGISNQGPRALLEKRHKEWVTLWNANCDAVKPKRRTELLHDLDMWERTQGGRMSGRQSTVVINDKDFDGPAWATKHDASFKDLIANARRSSAQAKNGGGQDAPPPTEQTNGDEKQEQ